jgi:hypothetical protein
MFVNITAKNVASTAIVENNAEGRRFISEFKRLNGKNAKVVLKGRHSDRVKLFKTIKRKYSIDVPWFIGERIAVYVYPKTLFGPEPKIKFPETFSYSGHTSLLKF